MSKSEQSGSALKNASAEDLLKSTQRSERFLGALMLQLGTATAGFVDKMKEAGEFDDGAARRAALALAALDGAMQLVEGSEDSPSRRAHKKAVSAANSLGREINADVDTMAENLLLTLEAVLILLSNGLQVAYYHFEEEEKECEEMEKGLIDAKILLLASLMFLGRRLATVIDRIMQTSDAIADGISNGEEPSDALRAKFYSC